ncbi:daxx-like protein isoform X2 [Drosophila suzukii]|uniref:Daxx-like protein isoform X2 n=1 Tax=Drosophila suzukii TaxID=28584 RepID=A0AB40DA25_DROSZ
MAKSNNGAKRRRLEDPLRQMASCGPRQILPAKLMNIPKASLGSVVTVSGVGAGPARAFPIPADPLRSMHIPSGITVTKHQKSILTTNGNLTISLAEPNNNNKNSNNNNNNTNSYNNNVKQVKMGTVQKVAWSVSSKAPSPNALITPVPSHQVRVTPGNQIRVTAGAKVIQSPIRVLPMTRPPVVIGQPQRQQQLQSQPQQQKPIIVGVTKPKAPMGQMLHQQQQQQQQKTLQGQVQQRIIAGQQQQRPSLGQLQQQQVQQQHLPRSLATPMQQQPKPLQSQPKPLAKPLQQPVPQKLTVVGQLQQQPKAIVGQQLQQPPKAIVGQQLQQPPKAILGQQLLQQPKAIVGQQLQQQPKAVVGQQLHQQPKAIVGQQPQQQPKPIAGQQLQQQPKAIVGQQPQQQPKAIVGQQPQQQPKPIAGQQQQQPPKAIVGQQQLQQPKAIVGQQLQQQPKAIVGQQLQKTSPSQILPQKITTVQLPQQKTSLGPVQQKQKPQKTPVGQLQLQQQQIAFLQLQQQRISIGQLQQQQGGMMGQFQQQHVPQKSILGLIQQQQKVLFGQPQVPKAPMGLLRPQLQPQLLQQNPLTTTPRQQSPKAQMAQQLINSVISQQGPAQQPSLPVVNQITHKSMTIQKLPMLQRAPTVTKVPPKQIFPQQLFPRQIFPQQTPPPAHLLQKQPPPHTSMQTPPFAHRPAMVRPATVAKITPVPPNSRSVFQVKAQSAGVVNAAAAIMSAARTLPFRSSSHKPATLPLPSTHLQGFTTSATPPQRLLATPPHCAAALNEPLLLNLPPTTSITPQLTPTTTPPPAGTPAAVQQQQLAKAAAFKLNSLPGASISPVTKTPASTPKRIQPITVLKKSDEEWRRYILEQQQQQQKQRGQLQPTSTPTIVLVESPPTTPPTDKPETERSTNSKEKTPTIKSITIDKKPNNLKRPVSATSSMRQCVNVITEIVDLDELPESPPEKRRKEESFPMKKPQEAAPPAVAPFTTEYAALIKLCREVDPSEDMERLANGKLTRYYYSAPDSFVMSRGFRHLLEMTMARIRSQPDVVYVHLKNVVDELMAQMVVNEVPRGKAVPSARESPHSRSFMPKEQQPWGREREQEQTPVWVDDQEELEEESDSPTTDKRLNERIRQLNRTLHSITKRIKMLEDADVDLNDDDSSYLQVERFKKRACQIYEKICDLTGESKRASRKLKPPIQFKDTAYPHFNRTLSAFVNRMREFPDYHDVLQILEHCNKEKELGLAKFEMKRIAYDAFAKVGKLLQSRRKTDLYETVTHFTANVKDPATSDPVLLAKLKENNKKHKKISDVLEKYAREQDLNAEERQEARLKEKKLKQEKAEKEAAKLAALAVDDDKPCTSAQAAAKAAAIAALMKSSSGRGNGNEPKRYINLKLLKLDDEDEDSEEEDEDSEDEDDVDKFVDNFKTNGEVSDADSEAVVETSPKKDPLAPAEEEDVIDITRAETGSKIDVAPPNGKLKIMSVSSLNANFVRVQNPHTNPNPLPIAKPVIADQIVISDEES